MSDAAADRPPGRHRRPDEDVTEGRPGGRAARPAGRRRWARRLGAAGLASALVLPHGASGQDGAPPGVRLAFTIAERLEADSNLGLDPGGEDPTFQASTELGFNLTSATPISTLSLDAGATLRLADGPDVDSGATFDGPVLSFDYDREVPSSSLALDGSYRRDDVAFLRSLDEFLDEDGDLVLPDDFEDFEGEGTRQSVTLGAALTLRDDARVGLGLSAALSVQDYQDVTSVDLEDNRRLRLGAGLRFSLTRASTLNLGLRRSIYEEDGAAGDDEATTGLDAALSIDRPRGPVTAALALDDTEDGLRTAVSFGRSLALPTGSVSGSIGATRAAEGGVDLTGNLSFDRETPRGAVSLALSQAVVDGDEDEEELVTTISAGYRRDLTPVASLGLDALYSGRRNTGTDALDQGLELGASLGYQVTRDWGLNVGYRHRVRDEDGLGRANGDTVFLTIGRSFVGGL